MKQSLIHLKLHSNVELVAVTNSNWGDSIVIEDAHFVNYTHSQDPETGAVGMNVNLMPFSPIDPKGKFTFGTKNVMAHTFNPCDQLQQMFIETTTGLSITKTKLEV